MFDLKMQLNSKFSRYRCKCIPESLNEARYRDPYRVTELNHFCMSAATETFRGVLL